MSRLPNSEFKNLQGLRNSLRGDIDKSMARAVLTSSKVSYVYVRNENLDMEIHGNKISHI